MGEGASRNPSTQLVLQPHRMGGGEAATHQPRISLCGEPDLAALPNRENSQPLQRAHPPCPPRFSTWVSIIVVLTSLCSRMFLHRANSVARLQQVANSRGSGPAPSDHRASLAACRHAGHRLPRSGSCSMPSRSRLLLVFSCSTLHRSAFQVEAAAMASADICPFTTHVTASRAAQDKR